MLVKGNIVPCIGTGWIQRTMVHMAHLLRGSRAVVKVVGDLVGGGQRILWPLAAIALHPGVLTPTRCVCREVLHRQGQAVTDAASHNPVRVQCRQLLHRRPVCLGVVQDQSRNVAEVPAAHRFCSIVEHLSNAISILAHRAAVDNIAEESASAGERTEVDKAAPLLAVPLPPAIRGGVNTPQLAQYLRGSGVDILEGMFEHCSRKHIAGGKSDTDNLGSLN